MDSEFWLRLLPPSVGAPCGWCLKDVEMVAVTEWRGVVFAVRDAPSGESGVISSLYVCPRPECRKPTLVFFDATRYSRSPVLERPPRVEKAGQLPRGTAQPIADLPPEIERDRLEAWSCLYGEDVRAAVIMGRAAVQRAARFLKADGAGLKAELRDLDEEAL